MPQSLTRQAVFLTFRLILATEIQYVFFTTQQKENQ